MNAAGTLPWQAAHLLMPFELVPLVTASDRAFVAIAPPFGKQCRCGGCDRRATAVALSASEPTYPVTYCEMHGRLVERRGRHVTYFPICAEDRCEELASTLTLIHATPTRSEWMLVCDVHRG
jgi:hypothetical protein